MAERVAIILAAGISSRMKTALPKVLHRVCGREMLSYVLDACRQGGVSKMYVVVGYGAEQVEQRFGGADDIVWVVQDEQKGTGHAVMCCKEYLKDFGGQTYVLCGDVPFIEANVLKKLAETHNAAGSSMTLATAVVDDPSGYGRIIRDSAGDMVGIVEHNDCTAEQLEIREVNPSYYLFDNRVLFEALERVRPDNVKNEYYLTDVLSIILEAGHKVSGVTAVRPEGAVGINSRVHLSEASRIMQQRIQAELMTGGVTIVDPASTWIDTGAEIGEDTVIKPFTYIGGAVRIGRGCHVGPFACLSENMVLEDGSNAEPGTGLVRVNKRQEQ